jgi:hypothetical protein
VLKPQRVRPAPLTKPPKPKPKPKKVKVVREFKPDARMSSEQRLIARITILTECSRYIQCKTSSTEKRYELTWKLIESMDYSDEWLATVNELKLDAMYNLLNSPNWHDVIEND